ncbi:MAG TPA: hypothetical protein VKD72_15375 [Gemmataceae bacterium]|nr:hypothetical protein [Gemmataceae bacterium]
MGPGPAGGAIPEDRRKEIFLALVDAQDHEVGVGESRRMIAARFGVSEAEVRRIEREGLDQNWPPL